MYDPESMEELNTELNIVYRYLRKSGVPHLDAQDIVQETAYKFLLYYDSIQTPKIRSWLIRVALNFHYDQYRKNKKLDFTETQVEMLSNDLPENILLQKEKWSEIEHILSQLKPQYKELILLKYREDLSYDEISLLLDMKMNTIRTSLYRARKQFTKLYKEAL